jgi:hypothetical protein
MSLPEAPRGEAPLPHTEPVSIARVAFTAALGPLAWFVDLSLRFFLVEFGVARAHEGVVIAVGATAFAVALTAALGCHRLRRRARAQGGEVDFAAILGVTLGAFSALVIAAALLPHLYFDGVGTP